MSIARLDVAVYLDNQFGPIAVAVGQLMADDGYAGYGGDIDDALRMLGYTESQLGTAVVGDELRDAYLALAQYYTARRMFRWMGDRVNHTMGVSIFDFKDQANRVKAMMEAAAVMCARLGFSVDGRIVPKLPSFIVY
jgi:hypothetical protein